MTLISFQLSDYDYELPKQLIAQAPCERRTESRLLVIDRERSGKIEHRRFTELARFLRPDDLLVVNDTRVVAARICGNKETGGKVELLVLDPYKDRKAADSEGYQCLLKASKPARVGSRLIFGDGVEATVLTPVSQGRCCLRFEPKAPISEILDRVGQVPLPPYIERNGSKPASVDDVSAYQTVYARNPGAVAAPTAGLHFSEELLDSFRALGVELATITLHVGYGTFAPVRLDDIREHRMHSEHVTISAESAARIELARTTGRRIVAVGTTVVRALEWVAVQHGSVVSFSGPCRHYIYPGYDFGVVGAMITNFHLPKSTLLLLVSAFAGRETILAAYREAIKACYRFYSYGDAMLIL